MKNTLNIIFILFVNLCFGQPTFSLNNGGTDQTNYYSTLQYENVNDKIILKIKIKGEAYRFILDTGAPTMISSKIFEALKPNVITTISVSDANDLKDSMTVVALDEITLGDIVFKGIPTLVAKQNLAFDCFDIDGFIGSNLLRNSILQIDHQTNQVTITDDVKRLNLDPKESSKIFLDGQSSPYIWVGLQNKKKGKEQLLLDTGMSGLYDLSLSHLGIFQKKNIFEVKSKGYGSNLIGLHGLAKDTVIYRLLLPAMKINGATLKNITTETTLDNNSRVGAELLHYGIVVIDYKNQKFYFSPYTKTEMDVSNKQFPISFSPENNKIFVSTVWDNALSSKISAGDQIIAIDGVNYETINICNLLVKSIWKDKDKISLTTKKKTGEIVETIIERN